MANLYLCSSSHDEIAFASKTDYCTICEKIESLIEKIAELDGVIGELEYERAHSNEF